MNWIWRKIIFRIFYLMNFFLQVDSSEFWDEILWYTSYLSRSLNQWERSKLSTPTNKITPTNNQSKQEWLVEQSQSRKLFQSVIAWIKSFNESYSLNSRIVYIGCNNVTLQYLSIYCSHNNDFNNWHLSRRWKPFYWLP